MLETTSMEADAKRGRMNPVRLIVCFLIMWCCRHSRKHAGPLETASCLRTSGSPSGWVLAGRHLGTVASLEVLQHPLIHLERDGFLHWVHVLDCRGGLWGVRGHCPIGGDIVIGIQARHPLAAGHLGPVLLVKPRGVFEPVLVHGQNEGVFVSHGWGESTPWDRK